MEESRISLVVAAIALLTALYALLAKSGKTEREITGDQFITKPLQLQAYERLVLLCERISLPSLISRTNHPGLTAREMQVFLIESIKQEFEYNISQQVYVSTHAWDAVRNLRDQTMLVINKIANVTPAEAKAGELNKQLLELMMQQEGKALHTMTLEILNTEAKQLMK